MPGGWQRKNGVGKRVEGLNNFYAIRFEYIPKDRLNKKNATLKYYVK